MKKKNKIITIIIIIFSVFIICIGGYIIYNKIVPQTNVIKSQSNNKEQKNFSITEANQILINLFGENYISDLYTVGEDCYNNEDYQTVLAIKKTRVSDQKYNCEEILPGQLEKRDNQFWISNEKVSGICFNQLFYDYNDVNNNYKSLFGKDKSALKENVVATLMNEYAYSKSKNGYVYISCQCDIEQEPNIFGLTKAFTIGNKLYINVVANILKADNNKFLLTLTDNTIVNLSEQEKNDKTIYKKYLDKMFKYQFTFEKEDNNYIFKSFKKT